MCDRPNGVGASSLAHPPHPPSPSPLRVRRGEGEPLRFGNYFMHKVNEKTWLSEQLVVLCSIGDANGRRLPLLHSFESNAQIADVRTRATGDDQAI